MTIATYLNDRVAYASKPFARPLYFRTMAKVSQQMSKKD